jgi:hypothetical protein
MEQENYNEHEWAGTLGTAYVLHQKTPTDSSGSVGHRILLSSSETLLFLAVEETDEMPEAFNICSSGCTHSHSP